MPTSCLCSRIQLEIACLCLASACERFAYISDIGCVCHFIFFPLGNDFPLLGTKILSSGADKFQKKILWGCVWGKDKEIFVIHGHNFSLDYGNSQSFSLLVLRNYPHLALNCQRGAGAWCFAPGFFFKAPESIVGDLHILFCSSLILTASSQTLVGASFPCLLLTFPFHGSPVAAFFPADSLCPLLLPAQPNLTANANVQST